MTRRTINARLQLDGIVVNIEIDLIADLLQFSLQIIRRQQRHKMVRHQMSHQRSREMFRDRLRNPPDTLIPAVHPIEAVIFLESRDIQTYRAKLSQCTVFLPYHRAAQRFSEEIMHTKKISIFVRFSVLRDLFV